MIAVRDAPVRVPVLEELPPDQRRKVIFIGVLAPLVLRIAFALMVTWLLGIVGLVLAGGLTPENVAEAILETQPDGVDTASGVEVSPGLKSAALVKAFASKARAAIGERRRS